jgi:hypothetical protein
MTTTQFVIAFFALLIAGLLLPLPYGARLTIFMGLIVLGVLAFIGGGMQYLISLFE